MDSKSDSSNAGPERYRAKVASTLELAALVYRPLTASGAVLGVLRGRLYHQRNIRNVLDVVAAPSHSSTANEAEEVADTARAAVTATYHTPSASSAGAGVDSSSGTTTAATASTPPAYLAGPCKMCLLDPEVLCPADLGTSPGTLPPPASSTASAAPAMPVWVLGVGVRGDDVRAQLDAAVQHNVLSRRAADLLQHLHDKLTAGGGTSASSADGAAASKKRVGHSSPIEVSFTTHSVSLGYRNYTMPELLAMVLPVREEADLVALSGFEQVGHIAHVNLSAAHLPHADVIGQVILDCNETLSIVVNKVDAISSVFREFKMDIIAERPRPSGEVPSSGAAEGVTTQAERHIIAQEAEAAASSNGSVAADDARLNRLLTATVRQHGCTFRVPYNRVYWNSRLSFEHTRLVERMRRGDVLFDVMAGVGPFAVPAAKNGVQVFANDLNPVAAQYMKVNGELNHIPTRLLHVYNMDGRDFLNTVLFDSITQAAAPQGRTCTGRRHVTMNLPAIAVEFLDVFQPCKAGAAVRARNARWSSLPASVVPESVDRRTLFHVYCFSAAEDLCADAVRQVEAHLGYSLPAESVEEALMVRDVAPTKRMMCVSFTLPPAFWANLFASQERAEAPCTVAAGAPGAEAAPASKKLKTETR